MGADNDIVERANATADYLQESAELMPESMCARAYRELREAAAEIVRLRGEVEALATELGERVALTYPDAPAMPNGVEAADVHLAAEMLTWGREEGLTVKQEAEVAAHAEKLFRLLRAADNRDAAGVDRPAPGDCSHYFPMDPRVCVRCGWDFRTGEPPTPAAVPAGEAVAQTLRDALAYVGYRTDGDLPTLAERAELWMRESRVLIDSQSELIAWMKADATTPQPADGEAVAPFGYAADVDPGDFDMSHTMYLLRPGEQIPAGCTALYTTPPAPVQAAPQEGEDAAEAYRKAWEAGHAAACELGAVRARFEDWMVNVAKIIVGSSDPYPARLEQDYWRVWQAALQHRGDSRGGEATP